MNTAEITFKSHGVTLLDAKEVQEAIQTIHSNFELKLAELEKERDEALILCDFKDKDIDACASVLSNVYSSGVNLEEFEGDVKHMLIDHVYASSTNGKTFEALHLEQQAKGVAQVQMILRGNDWEDDELQLTLASRVIELNIKAKALKEQVK